MLTVLCLSTSKGTEVLRINIFIRGEGLLRKVLVLKADMYKAEDEGMAISISRVLVKENVSVSGKEVPSFVNVVTGGSNLEN